MMTHGLQQTGWHVPKFTIDCVLVNVNRQLEADGCVLESTNGGCKLSTPDHMTVGDFVKVQLWLDGEEAFVDIRLAEVRRVHNHWIAVEVIQLSPNDRLRLQRFIDGPTATHAKEPVFIDHLLIRA
jgi:PilZ domain